MNSKRDYDLRLFLRFYLSIIMYYTRNQSPPGDISADKTNSIKPEFSTFIEELEETTEKLMNEVFNLPSISEIRPL